MLGKAMSARPSPSTLVALRRGVSKLLVIGLATAAIAAAQQPAPAPAVPAQQHPYDMQHVGLEIHPDFQTRSLRVEELLVFRSRVRALDQLDLDSDGPVIESITDAGGAALKFSGKDGKLDIRLSHPLHTGEAGSVTIRYHVTPKGGAVFYPGDVLHPRQATYFWTSGEPDTNHLWLPIYDHPNDKLTADFRVSAPAGDQVIANGKLLGMRTLADGETEFHWSQDAPISSYLLAVYIGRWKTVEDHAGKVPLEYVTTPDENGADARARFGRTPQMIAFYESRLGVPYPWAKYAEVRNPGFFASLENASATEFSGDFPGNADIANILEAYRSEDITLSHELAHQWFGDLVTCRHWSDLWVNEGMATFMQHQWDGHANGKDRAISGWEEAARQYFRSEGGRPKLLTRPASIYKDPWNMFDATTYNKGSWAVRTLEGQIGSKALWKGLHVYLTRYREGSGDTGRFEKVMEEVSGKNLQPFFEQWFHTPGHPVFEASWKWDGSAHAAMVEVQQKGEHLYTGTIPVAVWVNGQRTDRTLDLTGRTQSLRMDLPGQPQLVEIDPDHFWLKELHWRHRSVAEWTWSAEHAPWSADRVDAIEELSRGCGSGHRTEFAALLQHILEQDASVDVRTAALQALAGADPVAAQAWALRFLSGHDVDLREAGAEALAHLPVAAATVAPLETAFRHDGISAVRAAALIALLHQNSAHRPAYLNEALAMKSYEWQVESAALGEMSKQGAAALPVLMRWSAPTIPSPVREAALRGLGRVGRGNQPAIERLRTALQGPLGPGQVDAALALAQIGDKASLPAIERLRDTIWVGFFRSAFAAAAQQLQSR